MLKKLFLLVICIFMTYTVLAQKNLSVPLTDPVYTILEYSQLRNYCGKLHNSRPYTLDFILNTLNTILYHPQISVEEKVIVQDTMNRLKPPPPTQFTEGASFWQNTKTLAKTGTYRYEKNYIDAYAPKLISFDQYSIPNLKGEFSPTHYVKGNFPAEVSVSYAHSILIEDNTLYRLSFDYVTTEIPDNVLFFDLQGEGYDFPEQDFTFIFETGKTHYETIISSGDTVPELVYFRVLSYNNVDIVLENLQLVEVTEQQTTAANNAGIPITVEIGATWETNIAANFNDPSASNYNWLDVFLLGDIGNNFSYNINVGMGIMKLDFSSYRPYSFSQSWDGYQYVMSDLASFAGASQEMSAGIRLLPEFGISFWDKKLEINFSRVRHDWGTGNGNLMISNTARPFVALEMHLRPVDFISLSYMTGMLEFFNSDGIKISADNFQNAYTAFMGEIFFGEYAYAALTSSVIWPKRFELGYLIPGMIPFFYQNMIGDFDNMLMGISLGANIPGSANVYFNFFMDELHILSDDFFNRARNMYAYQAGLKVAIANKTFTTFNVQYTKLEPYMYTHPGAVGPWYGDKTMKTNYVNHGENIGYNLQPNSDELKIIATTIPFWYLQTDFFYSLVRHGTTYGSRKVPGSSIDDKHDYSTDISGITKYFLRDGAYEWIHSLGINAQLDLGFVKDIPLTLNIAYTLNYKHHTDWINYVIVPATSSEYKNGFGNYLSLSIKVY